MKEYRIRKKNRLFYVEIYAVDYKGLFFKKVYAWFPCTIDGNKYWSGYQERLKPFKTLKEAREQVSIFLEPEEFYET